MSAVLAADVTMPFWVFLLLVVILVGINAFLMWCNHDQADTIRRQNKRLYRGTVTDRDIAEAIGIPRQRQAGDR